ncbi:MAG: hypothetical protein H6Q73_1432 [Firmicutes bacterium]|nr:hypothetical protein [Bacillota bacterium]
MRGLVKVLWLALVFVIALTAANSTSYSNDSPVVVIDIRGEIDDGQVALVHKAITEAKDKNPRAILVELDTFGGLVEAATKIRDAIGDSPVLTICYIKNRAWSAGALIAISHQKIAIAPGGSIGAAEPIPATEKTIAALKAEFAAVANKTGREPAVAEAMVDKSRGYPGYAEPGQILALTDYQAVKVGYADLVAANRAEVLAYYGLDDAPVIEYTMGWSEKFAGVLSNPLVKSALISLIFLAVFVEIKTAGTGIAALVAVIGALVFFVSQWFTGLAGWLEVLLFIGGALAIIVELYVPGFGIFGIGGITAILTSFFLTLGADSMALNILAASIIAAIIIFLLLLKKLPSSRLWLKFVLENAATSKAGYIASSDYLSYLGCQGITLTQLRPAGTVEIDGVHLDVVSEGEYIEARTLIKVIAVNGNRIVVRRFDSKQN